VVEPSVFRFNEETSGTNVFQHAPAQAEDGGSLPEEALAQHRALQRLLAARGLIVTVFQASGETPDAPFCNNWFSTHPAMKGLRDGHGMMEEDVPPTLVLYPLMARNRRLERRRELVEGLFRRLYPRVINMAHHEERGLYLESTGSLCMDDANRTVYAALSERTDRHLAEAWADKMGYRLVAFNACDASGVPYYHTNVMMYVGHGLAGVCLESIENATERRLVEESLRESGLTVLPITRRQVLEFCGNALSLTNGAGERLLVMSSRAWAGYSEEQRAVIEGHCEVLHTDLSVFENVGGGSARCLIGELF
jgi:hypothetical protein